MSFVGKVLIVVQVVMSLCFMAFAGAVFAVHENWKAEFETSKAALAQSDADMQTLRQEKEAAAAKFDVDLKAAQGAAQQAQAALQIVTNERDTLKTKSDQLERELTTQTSLASAKSIESGFRLEESVKYRDINKALQAALDTKTVDNRKLQDEIFSLNLKQEELVAQNMGLLKDNAFLQKVVRVHGLETDPRKLAAKDEPAPPVEGLVVDVRKDSTNRPKYVEISIGSDDGLIENHTLDVYRSAVRNGNGKSQYLGKVRVINVWPDRAVCLVVNEAKNGIIEQGDNVTTKL